MPWIGAAIGALAGPVISGIFGNNAADTQANAAQNAANTSAAATNSATDLQRQIYQQTRADQTPFREAGVNALNNLTTMTAPGYNFQSNDPGYGFRLSEGLKALDRSAAARGGLLSGSALKGINRYAQDYASNEYGNSFCRQATIAGFGPVAANSLAGAGQNYAGNAGNLAMTNAANQGNAYLSAGAARASAYGGIGNSIGYNSGAIGNAFNQWNNQQQSQQVQDMFNAQFNDPNMGP